MAKQAQDMTAVMKDIMGAFPIDTKAFEEAYANTTTLNEKLAAVAFGAAEKSAEVSNKWAKDTLSKLTDMSKAKAEPADYAKALTDFASQQAEVTAENLSVFAEIVKKAQMDTVELMMSAGKSLTEEANAAVKKATNDITAAAKKAAKQ